MTGYTFDRGLFRVNVNKRTIRVYLLGPSGPIAETAARTFTETETAHGIVTWIDEETGPEATLRAIKQFAT